MTQRQETGIIGTPRTELGGQDCLPVHPYVATLGTAAFSPALAGSASYTGAQTPLVSVQIHRTRTAAPSMASELL